MARHLYTPDEVSFCRTPSAMMDPSIPLMHSPNSIRSNTRGKDIPTPERCSSISSRDSRHLLLSPRMVGRELSKSDGSLTSEKVSAASDATRSSLTRSTFLYPSLPLVTCCLIPYGCILHDLISACRSLCKSLSLKPLILIKAPHP